MLKIHQIFILQFVGLLVSVLLISSIISYFSLKSSIIQANVQHLENTISIIALELDAIDDLDKYIKKIASKTALRVTIIDTKGVVIAESHFDKNTMENHLGRDEVQLADTQEFTYRLRYSNTLKIDFLYVVKKVFYKGREVYLRLSMDVSNIMDDFYTLWYKLLSAFIFIVGIAFYISKMMSKRVLYDINQITKYLDEVSNKNYAAVIKTKYFYEFLQISLMLKNLVKKLSNKEKQKEKYMAKLKQVKKQRDKFFLKLSNGFKDEKIVK